MLEEKRLINCRGELIDASSPIIMGIINLTPDSFYKKSRVTGVDSAIETAIKMGDNGATIVDVGGMSSRPGAEIIPWKTELDRVLPVVKALKSSTQIFISIDTVHHQVAEACLKEGAHIINDISANPGLWSLAAEYNAPYVLMHMLGMPNNMQLNPIYSEGVVREVMMFLINKIRRIEALGVRDIIIDPGFGFGKTVRDNFLLLKNLSTFRILERPVLVGVSRKSMLNKTLKKTPSKTLNATTAAHMLALENGASILRTHDVEAAQDAIGIWEAYSTA